MSKKQTNSNQDIPEQVEEEILQSENEVEQESSEQNDEELDWKNELNSMREKCADLADKNLRMMAEFDNYRRRTNKEKLELINTAGERIFKDMLPLVDDFERAQQAMKQTDDIDAVRDGISLIYNKFITFLAQNNVKPIDTDNADFDTEFHEAITTFPAPTPEQKGKVIDCTQKGYTLGEKVIRYAKVVVGE